MNNRKKTTAAILAAAIALTGAMIPASSIWAEENQVASQSGITEKTQTALPSVAAGLSDGTTAGTAEMSANPLGMTEEEIEEAAMASDGVEIVDLPESDGDYLIYMEPEAAETVSIQNEVQEIAADSPELIVEADLSAAEARELEAKSIQSEEIYIEKNIYLDGASIEKIPTEASAANDTADTADSTDESAEDDTSFLASMDALERHNWKKAMLDQQLTEETQAEWNLQMVHANNPEEENTGVPVKVAVLDSGVEFLAGFPVERSINLVKDEQELPYYMNDMTGHGTAVADIIHRVCPGAQIYAVKVMDANNRGRLSDIVAGIYWCIEQDVDVINMSFGTSVKSDILEKAIQAAAEHGILMVSSAGNGGTGSAVEYPAAFDEVIAVGAVDTGAEKTEESATGEEVELAAPGEQIIAKSLLGLNTVASGTSMAAPHVAGAAALLMMESQYKDAAFIRKVLQKSSNPLGDGTYYGSGLLDVAYARELLEAYEETVMAEWDAAGANGAGDSTGEEADSTAERTDGEADSTAENSDGEAGSRAKSSDGEVADTAEISSGEADSKTVFSGGEAGGTAEISEDGADSSAGNPAEKAAGTAEVSVNGDLQVSEAGQPDMPSDALDAVVQTEKPVETFEEIDYVEGRWSNNRHSELADKQGTKNGLTAKEIKLLKAGATYSDVSGHHMKGGTRKYWHGRVESNYIANYIFVTQAAISGGDVSKLNPIPGLQTVCFPQDDESVRSVYDDIKAGMSDTKLFGRTWNDIMNEIQGLSGYNGQKQWRRVFIYGLALHLATDTFAHSSCYRAADGTIKKYLHKTDSNYDPNYGADHVNDTENRWKCANHTAGWVAYNCKYQVEGDVMDFSSYGYPCWKGFYMGNIYPYAKEADTVFGLDLIKTEFKSMTQKPTWVDWM